MQKAFPKVLAGVLCVIAYLVVLVVTVIGGSEASTKGWAIVVAVPLVALAMFLFSLRRRPSRSPRAPRESPGDGPSAG